MSDREENNTDSLCFDDLVLEKKLHTWQDFVKHSMHCSESNKLIWRGQRNADWEIEPSCMRVVSDEEKFNRCMELCADYYTMLLNISEHTKAVRLNPLCRFEIQPKLKTCGLKYYFEKIQQYRTYGEDVSSNDYKAFGSSYDITLGVEYDLNQWAWGQHYGIKTPLVDWTYYSLYALFFALDGCNVGDEVSVCSLNIPVLKQINMLPPRKYKKTISTLDKFFADPEELDKFVNFMFHYPNVRNYFKDKTIKKGDAIPQMVADEMAKLKVIAPPVERDQNPRIYSQGGLFTFAPGGISIEEWCRRIVEAKEVILNSQVDPFLQDKPLLIKYRFKIYSEQDRLKCLTFLEQANINAKTVYPDFFGLSNYVKYQHEKYAIRKPEEF